MTHLENALKELEVCRQERNEAEDEAAKLQRKVAELAGKLESVHTAATQEGLTAHQRWERILVAVGILNVTL